MVSQGYEPKGEYKTIAGLKTCMSPRILCPGRSVLLTLGLDVTGPADAAKALLVVSGTPRRLPFFPLYLSPFAC